MRIAIVTTGLLPVPATKGGAVENLIDFFLEVNESKREVEIDVYSCHDNAAEEQAKRKYPSTNFFFINTGNLLYKLSDWCVIKFNRIYPIGRLFGFLVGNKLKEKKYDAILVENFPFLCPSIKFFTETPVILHTHNRYVEVSYPLLRQYINKIDGLICVSQFIADDARRVKDKYGTTFPISVAHNGIHIENFHKPVPEKRKQELRSRLGISDDQKVIIFTGRFIPAKGVKELLQAFAMLPEMEKYVLLIIGASAFSGSNETPYIKKVKEIAKPIMGNVKFTGYIDYAEIPAYYAIADVQAVPSIWEEPACLVSLEGMAAGLPIVCSDSGGTPEHVGGGG